LRDGLSTVRTTASETGAQYDECLSDESRRIVRGGIRAESLHQNVSRDCVDQILARASDERGVKEHLVVLVARTL